MKYIFKIISGLLFISNGIEAESIDLEYASNLRLGTILLEHKTGEKTSNLSLGGSIKVQSKPINGLSTGVVFYTTNALFGKNSEAMFLDSNGKSYSIVGEAYLQGSFGKTAIKIGRQLFESPFINSDDIGMIPNTVEGYSLLNQNIPNTIVVLGLFNSWAGVDAPKPEKFTKMQTSGDGVVLLGAIYEGLENTTFQAWSYKLDDNYWNYIEAKYEGENGSVAGQYSNQGDGNSIFGVDATYAMENLSVHMAYNEVNGVVSNGFGGGPFFTSSEDHTVHESLDNKAMLMGLEYTFKDAIFAITHVNFSRCEDEIDYVLSYAIKDSLTIDLIYSDMNHDGTMSRFFANYRF